MEDVCRGSVLGASNLILIRCHLNAGQGSCPAGWEHEQGSARLGRAQPPGLRLLCGARAGLPTPGGLPTLQGLQTWGQTRSSRGSEGLQVRLQGDAQHGAAVQ